MNTVLTLMMPLILGSVGLYALGRKVDVFAALTDGAADGLRTLLRIFPALLMLLPMVLIFSDSSMANLQSVSIIAAFPVGLIIILIVASFFKDAGEYLKGSKE